MSFLHRVRLLVARIGSGMRTSLSRPKRGDTQLKCHCEGGPCDFDGTAALRRGCAGHGRKLLRRSTASGHPVDGSMTDKRSLAVCTRQDRELRLVCHHLACVVLDLDASWMPVLWHVTSAGLIMRLRSLYGRARGTPGLTACTTCTSASQRGNVMGAGFLIVYGTLRC